MKELEAEATAELPRRGDDAGPPARSEGSGKDGCQSI